MDRERLNNKGFTLIPAENKKLGAIIELSRREKQISAGMHTVCITTKLNLETCTKMLNNGKKKYSNEEVKQIREYLYLLAQLQIESENELVNLNN